MKQKLKSEDYTNCLKATQLENKIKYFEKKKKFDIDILKKDYKDFIKSNKLMLKTQPRFKNERHNVFTEESNNSALSSNDDKKKTQSIDSIEISTYGTSKDLVNEKEEIKCNNTKKNIQN